MPSRGRDVSTGIFEGETREKPSLRGKVSEGMRGDEAWGLLSPRREVSEAM